MTAAQLASLASSGFWIEDHTFNDGTSLWGRSPALIRQLTGQTASVLEGITHLPVQFIAYSGLWPFAAPTKVGAAESELFGELAPLGYVGGLEDNWAGRFAWTEQSTQLFELPRVRDYPGEPTKEFSQLLSFG